MSHNILSRQVNDADALDVIQPLHGVGKPRRMAVREVEVAAREAAMGENVIGGADSASVSRVF